MGLRRVSEFVAGHFWSPHGTSFKQGHDAFQVRPVAGARSHLSYVVIMRNDDGQHVVEHQAYFEDANGEITWLRIMCAGYIPV